VDTDGKPLVTGNNNEAGVSRRARMPGRDQGLAAVVIWCLPASSLARGPSAHPAEPAGEARSGAAGTEEMEEFPLFVARGRGTRTCLSRQARPVALGAHAASRPFPGGFRPRLAARQPIPDLR
jgi:hypothetical protein